VLTNDTDLVEPMRIVTRELGMYVTLLTPSAKPSASLMAVSSSVRHVRPYIGPCPLPSIAAWAGGSELRESFRRARAICFSTFT
jgi:hypothetical protein